MTDQPTSASTLPALKLSNVFKSYKDGPRVLTDFSLDLRPGCFCVLLGSSGSGKSTLLRCIVGLAPVDSGDIRLHGENFRSRPRRLHRVPQKSQAPESPIAGPKSCRT
ncbi:MAG TPA: hypothetical protein DDZ20_16170 [Hyphomonas sp.]|nr:hypothetical protein [Hyphomonas sp.]